MAAPMDNPVRIWPRFQDSYSFVESLEILSCQLVKAGCFQAVRSQFYTDFAAIAAGNIGLITH